jgi:hypothetical protein
MMEQPKDTRSQKSNIITYLLVGGMIVIVVVVILALMGPTVGNIFSNVGGGLQR